VRVIIELEDEPVAAWKSALAPRAGQLTMAEASQVHAYAEALRTAQQQVIDRIEAQGIRLQISRRFGYLFNGVAGTVKEGDIERIAALPGVQAVNPDYQMRATLDDTVPLIGADEVWDVMDDQGHSVTGKGIRVAVLDTGIDYTHPDLGGCFGSGCKVIGGYDFVNGDADPMDDAGHGTHCAGIIAARGVVTGVAPDASLYAYKVCDAFRSCWTSNVIAGIERAVDPDDNPATSDAVDVISISLGRSSAGNRYDDQSSAVDAAVEEGVVVVANAGNRGPEYQTVETPGVARKAFTVGATDRGDDLADFSSRGPTPGYLGLIKPEIVAPGVEVNSTVPGGGHGPMSGTSMAAPHVAGAVALIKQLHPTWSPEMIKANLMNTARDLGLDVYTQGAGRVWVDEAARAQAVLAPGVVGIRIEGTQPLWTATETLELTSVATTSLGYSLQVTGTLPNGITATVDPPAVTLPAGESITVGLSITVDNTVVPYPGDLPFSYEGRLIAQSATQALAVPLAFRKGPSLEMSFGESPQIVKVHNGVEEVLFLGRPGVSSLSALVPQGSYDVIVLHGPHYETLVLREGVEVTGTTRLSASPEDAVYTITLDPRDKGDYPIPPDATYVAQYLEHEASGIYQQLWGDEDCGHQLSFSEISPDYSWQWRIDASHNGDWYELNGAQAGISEDMTYQNDPSAFRRVLYQVHPSPYQSQVQLERWTNTRPYG
jgi:subtilisin family serine protease